MYLRDRVSVLVKGYPCNDGIHTCLNELNVDSYDPKSSFLYYSQFVSGYIEIAICSELDLEWRSFRVDIS